MSQELIKYISRGRGAGVPDDGLRDILLDAGWSLEEVNTAMAEAGSHLPIINSLSTKVEDYQLELGAGHRRAFFGVIVIIGLVVCGAIGAFAYQSYGQNRNPSQVEKKMLANLAKISAVKYDGLLKLSLNYQSTLAGDSTSSVKLPEVAIDQGAVTEIAFSGTVLANNNERPRLLLSTQVNKVGLGQDVFKTNLETRLIGDELYLYISQIDRLPLIDLRSLARVWLLVVPADTAWLGLDSIITAPSINQTIAWRSALVKSQAIHLTDLLERTLVNDVEVNKYSFTVDSAYFDLWLGKLAQVVGHQDLPASLQLVSSGSVVGGEIWLGVKDNLPYKLVISSPVGDRSGSQTDGEVSLDLNLSAFDQPVLVDKPSNAQPISDFFKDLIESASSTNKKP